MKKLYLPLLFFMLWRPAFSQQEVQYTQFMFNKLTYNPAYAGNFESPTLTAIYRKQWIGLEGSPETQILSYNQRAVRNRVGVGGSLMRHSIGITRTTTFNVSYTYRIPLRRGHLGIGIMPSVRHMYQDWTDPRLNPSQQLDNAIPNEPKTKFLANIGLGLFYSTYKWFAGVAAPRLNNNNIDFADLGGKLSREVMHLNAMGGITFEVTEGVALTPQVLLKYVIHAPFDADVNCSVMLKQKFYGGLTYRTGGDTNGAGESVDVMAGIQATENLFLCLSYDITLSRLRKYNSGSLEATVRWWFNPPSFGGEDIETDNPNAF